MRKRIWELDALRGLGILGVVAVHLVYDITEMFPIWQPQDKTLLYFLQEWGGILFLVLSGICVTLGTKHIRRGLIVLACGLLVSAVTVAMYRLDFAGRDVIVYFGVLHCLGICMLLWAAFRYVPVWLLPLFAVVFIYGGFYFMENVTPESMWLLALGAMPGNFVTADFFPLLPNLGYFLIGAALGKILYKNKQSLLPWVSERNPVAAVFCWLGRNSLWIYLAHQPLIVGILTLTVKE